MLTLKERLERLRIIAPGLKDISVRQWYDWRWQMKNQLKGLDLLATAFKRNLTYKTIQKYPFRATPYYLSLIRKIEGPDPIKIQAIPDPRELETSPGESEDPLAETSLSPVPGLVHRYPDRALILTNNRCATLCRHCNRKRLWQRPLELKKDQIKAIIDYIRSRPQIKEAILSGGDPLLLNPKKLNYLLERLRQINHLEIIRIGTRLPVTLPMRIEEDILHILERHRPLWLLTHFNHPQEITPEAAEACEKLLKAGIPVLNQSVLLKGVNDSVATIRDLLRGLCRIGVKPYYLFQCDPVAGVGHLRTKVSKGLEILEALRGRLGGIAIPRFMVDLPGGKGKVPLEPDYLLETKANKLIFRNYQGEIVVYTEPL
ncbi:KamA family radical SAM protein [Thermosulfuriphilus sp.]